MPSEFDLEVSRRVKAMIIAGCQVHDQLVELVVLVVQQLPLVLVPVRIEALAVVVVIVAVAVAIANAAGVGGVRRQSVAAAGVDLRLENGVGAAREAELRPQEAGAARNLAVAQHDRRLDAVDDLKAEVERIYQQILDAELKVKHQPAKHTRLVANVGADLVPAPVPVVDVQMQQLAPFVAQFTHHLLGGRLVADVLGGGAGGQRLGLLAHRRAGRAPHLRRVLVATTTTTTATTTVAATTDDGVVRVPRRLSEERFYGVRNAFDLLDVTRVHDARVYNTAIGWRYLKQGKKKKLKTNRKGRIFKMTSNSIQQTNWAPTTVQ